MVGWLKSPLSYQSIRRWGKKWSVSLFAALNVRMKYFSPISYDPSLYHASFPIGKIEQYIPNRLINGYKVFRFFSMLNKPKYSH